MRERGMSTVAAVGLSALAAMLTTLVMMDWMVVDVQTHGPGAVHVVVPCPLLIPRIAASFIPDAVLEEAVVPPEVQAQRQAVITAVQALADTPDATLVKVDAPDALVEVAKQGDELLVSVAADDAVVRCKIPLDGVLEALQDWDWQTFDPGFAFTVLSEASNGELVSVEAEDATVKIAMW